MLLSGFVFLFPEFVCIYFFFGAVAPSMNSTHFPPIHHTQIVIVVSRKLDVSIYNAFMSNYLIVDILYRQPPPLRTCVHTSP
ncbi:hypothetical protein QR685DRAFT_326760 [Neurospora intermedia]|uniref:Secreted protein n=1 Tax=Neurospora intermedia TaxID=5142 RepID=A0ABR3DB79_NEUIN